MMKKTLSLTLLAAILAIGYEASACTNFLFTKGATKDGSTMITYAADSHTLYGELYYRTPLQPDTGDGNTVDLQAERQRFMENSLRYQTSLEFLNGRIAMFRRAIQGDAS